MFLDRPNLVFKVLEKKETMSMEYVSEIVINEFRGLCGIVYCFKNDKGAFKLVHVLIAMGFLYANLHNSKYAHITPFITVEDHSDLSNGIRTIVM
jgi:superfamily II DNA helicase RecQ